MLYFLLLLSFLVLSPVTFFFLLFAVIDFGVLSTLVMNWFVPFQASPVPSGSVGPFLLYEVEACGFLEAVVTFQIEEDEVVFQ